MNLQRVSNVLTNNSTSTLSIAFDKDTIGEDFYLDASLFLLIEVGIEICHSLVISMNASHTEMAMHSHLRNNS